MHLGPIPSRSPDAPAARRRSGRWAVVRGFVRRHRRPAAAILAALAALIALTSLRAPSTITSTPAAAPDPSMPRVGEVAVPVELASPALAASVRTGDQVDLVTPGADGPRVVARARVLALPSAGSGLVGSAGATLLVAVPEARALDIAVSPEDGYSLVIRPR